MTNNEEIERKMNFIVEQQAQFASDIQQLQESQAQTEQVVAQTTKAVAQTTEAVAQTAEAVAQSAENVGQVVDVVTRLANVTHAGFNDVNAKINALVDSQIRTEANLSRTDENLRSLISVVDRYLSEGRNGK
jgi:ABC-type transporter Mla subunit MlaD